MNDTPAPEHRHDDTPPTLRWRLLAVFWLLQAIVLYAGFSTWEATWGLEDLPSSLVDLITELVGYSKSHGLQVLAMVGLVTGLQAIFVTPIRKPTAGGRPSLSIFGALAVAGLLISLLATGLVISIVEVIDADDAIFSGTSFPPPSVALWGTMGLGWLIATPLLIAFCRRGSRERRLSRLAAWLFLGTIVETAAIIPLDVLVRRRGGCYCSAGTYWGLVICGTVGLFVLGPMIFLPVIAARRKRWYMNRCDVCAYDMTGLESLDQCPECGAGWRVPVGASARNKNKQAPEPGDSGA